MHYCNHSGVEFFPLVYKRASHSKNSSALEQLWQTILSLSMRANHKARAAAADDDESAKIRP